MPITPLHMGPALALKAVSGRYFSVLVFGVAQVAIDIEPIVGMIRGADVLHGWTHTYFGATLIAAIVALTSPPLCRRILKRWNAELAHHGAGWLGSDANIGRLATATGAFVGTYSHVALDSIMHADMAPFAPWDKSNHLLGLMSTDGIHLTCVVSGLTGIAAWVVLALFARRRMTPRPRSPR